MLCVRVTMSGWRNTWIRGSATWRQGKRWYDLQKKRTREKMQRRSEELDRKGHDFNSY